MANTTTEVDYLPKISKLCYPCLNACPIEHLLQFSTADRHSPAETKFTFGIAKTKICRVTDLGLGRRDLTEHKT